MNRYLPGKCNSAGAVRADTPHRRTGAHAGSACGAVVLAASMLTLPAVMLLASQAVMAQQERVLEEIIVTARKREESLLEIPESVATLSGTLIEQTNIRQLKDISLLVSNLYMSKRLDGFPNVSIRGLGGFGNTQGVGYYLDDVQIFTDASSRFGDLERIEVLKGPQGILYGGANIGGAVKFVAVRPDPEAFEGRVKLRAGEDGYYDGEGVLNIPLGTNWATRLFGFYEHDDSYLVNPNSTRQNGGVNSNDPDVGEWDRYGVRATLAGDITDRFSVYAALRYNKFEGPNNVWNVELDGNLTHTPVVDTSFNPQHEKETVGASLELAYDFDNFTLTSITSYTDTDSDRQTDLDTTQEFILDLFRPQQLEVLTQELRFTSTGAGPLQWQAGAYYLDYERDIDSKLLVRGGFGFLDDTCCPVPPPLDATESALLIPPDPFEDSDRERQQLAGFANVSYRWTNLELAGGVRVDRWEADRTNRLTAISGSQEETEVLGRGSLAWFFDDDRSMVYGLVSQGFEPGDFNLTNFAGVDALFGFLPEQATQYEIGYKGRLASDRVILTLAAFLIDYEDRQFELQTDDPTTGTVIEGIVNVGDSENWGLEADLVWSVHDNWTLSAGFGWVEAEWDNGTVSPVTGADLSGQTPPNTSDWSGVAAVDYSRKLNADTHLFGRLQVRHKAEASTNAQFFDAPGDDFPFWTNPDFTVIDLNLGVGWQNWEFAIQVENLTDEDYYIDAQEFPNFAGTARPTAPGGLIIIGTLEQPRRVVGSIQFRF